MVSVAGAELEVVASITAVPARSAEAGIPYTIAGEASLDNESPYDFNAPYA
jgi:hypothetical protein